MAIATTPKDFSASGIRLGAKTKRAVFYIFIGLVAIAIGVPTALMSADAGVFEECYGAVACAAQ